MLQSTLNGDLHYLTISSHRNIWQSLRNPPEESLKRQVGKKASCPDVSEKTGSKHNGKYGQDITALKKKFGNSFITGLCIRITLKEALEMMPRNRKRVDAYYGLTRYLQEEYGITLTIYSQKTKPNDHEEDYL